MNIEEVNEIQAEIESNFLKQVSRLVERGVKDRPSDFFEELRAMVTRFEEETRAVLTLKWGHTIRTEVKK